MADALIAAVPDFPEACRRAREMEKNLLKLSPIPLSGPMHPGVAENIFPEEFEAYTFAYLLTETQKIERKLYMSTLASQSPMQGQSGGQAQDKQATADLHSFASGQPFPSTLIAKEQKPAQQVSSPSAGTGLSGLLFGKKKAQAPLQQNTSQQVQADSQASPLGMEQSGQQPSEETPKSRFSQTVSFPSSSQIAPPSIPKARQVSDEGEKVGEKQQKRTFPTSQSIAPEEDEEEFVEPAKERSLQEDFEGPQEGDSKEPRETAKQQEPTSPDSPLKSSSKLSPRLRAIIEEKLRREDEKAKKEAPVEISAQPAEEGEKQPPQEKEEIIMSARERLLSKLQKKTAGKGGKMPASAVLEKESSEKEAAPQEGEKEPLEEAAPEEEKEEAEFLEEAETKEEAEIPAAPEKQGRPAAFPKSPSSGLQITPIFAGEEERQQEQKPSAKTDDSERLRRIQRIMEELAPDKYKASAILKKEVPEEEEEQAVPAKKSLPSAKQKIEAQPIAKKSAKPAPKMELRPSAKKAKKGIPNVGEEPAQAPQIARRMKKPAADEAEEEPQMGEEEPAQEPEIARKMKKPAQAKAPLAPKKAAQQGEEEEPEESEGEPVYAPKKRILPTRVIAGKMPAPKGRVLPAKVQVAQKKPVPAQVPQKKPLPVQAVRQKTTPVRKASQKTYIPPAKEQMLSRMEGENNEGQEEPRPKLLDKSVPKKLVSDERLQTEKTPEGTAEENRRQAASDSFRKKLSPESTAPAQQTQKSAEELKKTRDIAGEAKMPDESEENIDMAEIPKPPSEPEEQIPASADYEMAKEEFKRRMEEGELKETAAKNALAISEETLEQYAKGNLVWLYEIYKMGGMTREDFMQKTREKFEEAKQEGGQAQPAAEPPENPALAALGKEIDKKSKK